MKTAALIFVLAVVASQVELVLSAFLENGDMVDLTECPVFFYGKEYTETEVRFASDGSFTFCFANSGIKECIWLSNSVGATNLVTRVEAFGTGPPSALHTALESITDDAECTHILKVGSAEGFYIILYLRRLHEQTGLIIETLPGFPSRSLDVNTTFDGITQETWSFLVTRKLMYLDLSGCRTSNIFDFSPSINPIDCTATCSVENKSGVTVDVVTGCESPEVCDGNGQCIVPAPVCTVTGSTVIDFFNTVHSVPDLCVYTLLKNPEIEIYVGFNVRHLEEEPFLNHVIVFMIATSTTIYLEQGVRARVLTEILNLTSTPQTLHGVEVFKDDNGITLKTPSTQTIIHFDGDTAHVTGGDGEQSGVCGNPMSDTESQTTLVDSVNSAHSTSGCDASKSTDVAITANCSASDDYCDLMSQAPFTDCTLIDPEPFITACKSIACKYTEDDRPADYPACQYMQAYAKACFLKSAATLGDWRSTASCSTTRLASCLDQECTDHEFCAGEPGCFCRASFDHPRDVIAEATVCTPSSIEVTVVECLLWENGVDPTTLHLNDVTCKGESDPETGMMTFRVEGDDCGTEVTKDNASLVYKNAILMGSKPLSDITREKIVEIDFSCSVTPPELQSVTFKIKDGSVFQTIEDEELSYTLTMSAYTDANFNFMIDQDTDIELNQKVWVEIKTEDLDENTVAVVTDSCWLTTDVDPTSSPSHYLVVGGCPNPDDLTVEMEGNGLGLSNSFCFRMFQYTTGNAGNSELYLHCQVVLFPKSTPAPTCGGLRKRRSARPGYAGMARPPIG
ncbi:uncharacterized protein LOC130204496 [Pseudoliparis swirei]|uniref:uncharacterized protein LOC130204496 n=1 Tax=Pseudoliparis swirei TaxID=2059687 RepID=UPI0024BD5CCA|nr:uncharacterized protein LOC130204496 [Pseudoliparis swirei]